VKLVSKKPLSCWLSLLNHYVDRDEGLPERISLTKLTRLDAPVLPRRALVAAGLSASFAALVVSLAVLGGMSKAQSSSYQFSRSISFASGEEQRLRGMLAQALPDDRVHITVLGHTGTVGDIEANLALSEERAALVEEIARELGISSNRMTVSGVGGAIPLQRETDESERAYQARLARVDISLQLRR
jgi:flagellar motor protein MotB